MSDEHIPNTDSAYEKPSPGATLRNARVRRGLSVSEVADELRLTSRALRDLEEDRFSEFRARVFVIGYLKSYARFIGVDLDLVTRQFNDVFEESDEHDSIELVSDNSDWFYRFLQRHMSGLLSGSFILVLLVVSGIIWYYWSNEVVDEVDDFSSTVENVELETDMPEDGNKPFYLDPHEVDEESLQPNVQTHETDPAPAEDSNTVVSLVEEEVSESSDTVPIEIPDVPDEVEDEDPNADAVVSEEEDWVAPANSLLSPLVLTFTSESWIELQGTGEGEVYANLEQAGSEIKFSMTPPIKVKIGNARGTELTFRGNPVSFSGRTFSNVANLVLE